MVFFLSFYFVLEYFLNLTNYINIFSSMESHAYIGFSFFHLLSLFLT